MTSIELVELYGPPTSRAMIFQEDGDRETLTWSYVNMAAFFGVEVAVLSVTFDKNGKVLSVKKEK